MVLSLLLFLVGGRRLEFLWQEEKAGLKVF